GENRLAAGRKEPEPRRSRGKGVMLQLVMKKKILGTAQFVRPHVPSPLIVQFRPERYPAQIHRTHQSPPPAPAAAAAPGATGRPGLSCPRTAAAGKPRPACPAGALPATLQQRCCSVHAGDPHRSANRAPPTCAAT